MCMANKVTQIKNMIYEIRSQKVMLDRDLAGLYGVELKVMNQAVERNAGRFPSDFMFQLTEEEWKNLRSQIVTFNKDTRKYKPFLGSCRGRLFTTNHANMVLFVLSRGEPSPAH